jgi:hypothetical protein
MLRHLLCLIAFGVWITTALVAQAPPPAPAAPAPAPAASASIQISDVLPRSVIAGATFNIIVSLPAGFSDAITLGVHRTDLNIEQYRSRPLRDNDALDLNAEDGVLMHQVATDVKWTSAQALANNRASTEKYIVTIENPVILQIDQVVTVLGSSLFASIETLGALIDNVLKGASVLKDLRSRMPVRDPGSWGRFQLEAGDASAVKGSEWGAVYFNQAPASNEQSLAYLHGRDFLWATPDNLQYMSVKRTRPSSADSIASMLLFSEQVQADELTAEVAAIDDLLGRLPSSVQANLLKQQLQTLKGDTVIAR